MESLLLQCVVSLVIYPKYYKRSNKYCTFLFMGSLGCLGNTENYCNFANVSYFCGGSFILFMVNANEKYKTLINIK